MLELPGRLERSTLGDVLGALHRSGATGALRLDESGPEGSRQHVIYLREGLIAGIESPSGRAAPVRLDREQWLAQLDALFGLTRARLSFRVMGQQPSEAPHPLEPPEFLHGRQRRRDAARAAQRAERAVDPGRQRALALLGLSGDPAPEAIGAAFRQLARRWHPDRHPDAGELTRAALCRRFAQIAAAYRELMSASEPPAARVANSR